MYSSYEKAIIRTICYADIFDFPLTLDEIWKKMIKINPPAGGQKSKIANNVKKLKMLKKTKGYYSLENREDIVDLRIKKRKYLLYKYQIAEKTVKILKIIPTIKMIGITGTLAAENVDLNDDIDLLIISSTNFIWITRLIATFLVEMTGYRRHPGSSNCKDKICMNMYMDEKHMQLPVKDRDLYSAYEIIQLKPLFNKDFTYEKFLKENIWVKLYLPNFIDFRIPKSRIQTIPKENRYISVFLKIIEKTAEKFQLWYMRKRRTNEIISQGVIRFHPKDSSKWILEEYNNRLSKYL
jgi:hypothetical protein